LTSNQTQTTTFIDIPKEWDHSIHHLWQANQTQQALNNIIERLNGYQEQKPKGLLSQLGYYLFLVKDYNSASVVFKDAYTLYPDDKEILMNIAVSLSRAGKHKESIGYITQLLKTSPTNFTGWDSLASSYANIGEYEKATKAGTNALIIKDKKYGNADPSWSLPTKAIADYTKNKKNVIAFSLWGNEKRYIFGALRNLLLAPDMYPDWEIWIYADNSVSAGFLEIIEYLGGKVLLQAENQSLREKLCWRFNVANNDDVGYFLIRDIDSVFSLRESNAVQEWIDSGEWFHIIRDWWTHTDLILAGLWGGVSGVLPNLQTLLKGYTPTSVSTPNIDQWFLRDCIWRYVKTSCLIHDRCFKHGQTRPIPGNTPANKMHIGSCEYHQRQQFQENILSAWIRQGRST
jgi:tetratricopeptide (TPR) repeat protein